MYVYRYLSDSKYTQHPLQKFQLKMLNAKYGFSNYDSIWINISAYDIVIILCIIYCTLIYSQLAAAGKKNILGAILFCI